MKKVNRLLIGSMTSVTGGTITPAIPPGVRVRELWMEFTGDAAAGITPSFDAMGALTIKQTGPSNSGQLVQVDTLAPLVLQQNRRGGIVDSSYAAGGACYSSICAAYFYEHGDRVNCLHFKSGQGLAISFGSTGSGAAVWDSLTIEFYVEVADDQECMQFYVPVTTQRQITLGGTNPIEMEDNLLEFTATAGTVSNPTSLQLLSGTTVENEGSWEGLKRMGNSKYPVEATQTTLQSVLHGELFKPVDVLEMVRTGTTLRFSGGSGSTQLFQRFATFNDEAAASSIKQVSAISKAKKQALIESGMLPVGIRQLALPVLLPSPKTQAEMSAEKVLSSSPLEQVARTYASIGG